MKKSKNLPEIRFEGFTEDWEQRKLGEVANIYDGTHQTPKYTSSGIKFVSVENISNLESSKFISQEAYIKEYANKQAVKGDVLMTRIGDIGTAAVIETDEPLAYYVTLALLKPYQVDSQFLAILIHSPEVQNNIWKRTLHIAFPKKINLGEINQVEVKLPSIGEQKLIGAFFQKLDSQITLHQRKCDKLLDLKNSMLYKLFPKEGEKKPEIRFQSFTNDWEKTTISELLEERNEQLPEGKKYPLMAFVAYEGIVDKGKRYDRSALVKDSKNKKYKRTEFGDFIYSSNNLTTGSIGLNKFGKASISPVYSIFSTTEKADYKFIGACLTRKEFINEMIKTRQGVVYGQWRIHEKDFLAMEILVPNVQEQKLIGEYLSKLDSIIELNKEKLEKLKNIKSFLIDKMFV